MPSFPPAPFLKLTKQRAKGDCGIVALATLFSLPYEDVLDQASRLCKDSPHIVGLYGTDILRIANQLGHPLHRKRRCRFEADEGILGLASRKQKRGKKMNEDHWVVVSHGFIFDELDVWEPKEYFKVYPYKPRSILAVKYE